MNFKKQFILNTARLETDFKCTLLNDAEIQRDDLDILAVPNDDHVVICEPRQRFDLTEYVENTTFRFDHCFDENATTAQVN